MKQILILLLITLLVSAQKTEEPQKEEEKHTSNEIHTSIHSISELGPFFGSLLANILSEFGDKTFIIAAVMAMKFQRVPVFIGACGALMFMTFIGCVFGYYLPTLISPKYTSLIAGVLLLVFGGKLLYEAIFDGGEEGEDEEKEIEKEVSKLKNKLKEDKVDQNQTLFQQIFSKKNTYVIVAGFSQVFFGEWGDRSQLTTIALAADNDALMVFLGSAIGQSICTFIAVMGGKYLAEKVSERVLQIGSGILMLVFSVHAFFK